MEYAGIFLERKKCYGTIIERVKRSDYSLQEGSGGDAFIPKQLFATPLSEKNPLRDIEMCVERLFGYSNSLAGVGVASFGPFLSLGWYMRGLKPSTELYGVTTEGADKPLKSIDIYGVVNRKVSGLNPATPDIPVMVHTDGMAGAIAEAYYNDLSEDDLIAYIFIAEGVGGAYIRGKTPFWSEWTSEMGNVQVSWSKDDIDLGVDRSIRDIGTVISYQSLCQRYAKIKGIPNFSGGLDEVMLEPTCRKIAAHYAAQLCIDLFSIFPPKQIIIGGEAACINDFVEEVNVQFLELKDKRRGMASIILPNKYIIGSRKITTLVEDGNVNGHYKVDRQFFGAAYLGYFATQI